MSTTRSITPAVRGVALALGILLAFGAASRALAGFDFTIWLLDTRALPSFVGAALVAIGAVVLLAWAIRPMQGRFGRGATAGIVGVLAVVATANAAVFWCLAARGTIHAGVIVPLSALFAGAFGTIAWQAATRVRGENARLDAMKTAAAGLACVVVFPVLQVFAFGHTDYRRVADLAVVPGARVHADGTLSMAVDDRVTTAAALYRAGLARRLLMSGGPGDGAIHETTAMRARAIALGVRAEDILVDRDGLNTAATVSDTMSLLGDAAATRRVMVVSEFYHLPRLKLAFQRAGLDVATVPSKPGHWLRNWPVASIVREIPAFWSYALRPARAFLPRPASHASSKPIPDSPC